jgi:preprotein translocase subunit SecE
MSNRAIRRQQLKEPKPGKETRSAQSAIPGTGPSRPSQREHSRGGPLSWRPRFVTEIISELRKVIWPTRDDVVYLTFVVVVVTIVIGAILGGIDMGFGWLIDKTLLN